jgi:superfamily II DNA or RNA helicase
VLERLDPVACNARECSSPLLASDGAANPGCDIEHSGGDDGAAPPPASGRRILVYSSVMAQTPSSPAGGRDRRPIRASPGAPSSAPRARSTRAVLAASVKAQDDAEALVEIAERARAEVSAAYQVVRERQVDAATATTSIEAIKDVTDRRLRLDELPAHGIFTVADVLRVDQERLVAVPGIGPGTAPKVVAAAEQVKGALYDSLPFRIAYDPSDAAATRLLQALAVWGAVRHASEAYAVPARQLSEQLADQRPLAAPAAANPVRRLFLRGHRRRAAEAAAAHVRILLQDAESTGLLRAAQDVRAVTVPPPEAVWLDFERQSAAYYGLLGQVVRLGGEVAAEGFLPADIVERINDLQLDTSRLSPDLRLRGYQTFGARFVLVQRRVVLGDEMGLGKTVQSIATMAHLAATGSTHFVVVCPASVLINWTREIAQHSTLPVVALHGTNRARTTRAWQAEGGVAVTTFGSIGALASSPVRPALLVVDEAHFVKNPNAMRSRAVARLTERSDRVLFLTGTPMENRIDEFQSLVSQLRPEIAANLRDAHGALGVEAFRRVAAPVYLRRNQEDVLSELPELVQVEEWEEFGPEDGAAYRTAVEDGNFMAMRRAAFAVSRPRDSAKMTRLLEIADEANANDRKVVIFSYFRAVLDQIVAALGDRAYGPISGSTPTPQRQPIVDEFSNATRPGALVCQIEAAGVGLNVQAASVVILCEPQLKPSIEAQAVARAHRMGQVRSVQVHRLLIEDSVDQRLLEILDSKAQLFDAYVRHSAIAEASPSAVDVSEIQLARMIVAQEQRRFTTSPPRDAITSIR